MLLLKLMGFPGKKATHAGLIISNENMIWVNNSLISFEDHQTPSCDQKSLVVRMAESNCTA